jgi:hypothetical protein
VKRIKISIKINNKNVKSDVMNKGFVLVPSDNFEFSDDAKEHLEYFIKDWDDLKVDTFLKDNGKYRLRRYGRFDLNSQERFLERSKDESYFQGINYNPINGGIKREFECLHEKRYNDKFLKDLIMLNFDNLPIPLEYNKWHVGIHQIRVIASPSQIGKPTPEGPHKDGEMFTVQHFIKRENVDGGTFSIFDNNRNLIEDWTQNELMDSVYFKDSSIYHGVSPVISRDTQSTGIRDVLLIDFNPLK